MEKKWKEIHTRKSKKVKRKGIQHRKNIPAVENIRNRKKKTEEKNVKAKNNYKRERRIKEKKESQNL